MANATLATIDAAMNTALSALVSGPPAPNTPFAVCARYAGPVTKKGLSNVCREQYPAVMLRFDGETITRDICDKELTSLKPSTENTDLLKTMVNTCDKAYENKEGTMYLSFNAFCKLEAISWIVNVTSGAQD
jgi:hypothetical protein